MGMTLDTLSTPNWYIAQTKPGKTALAEDHLHQQHFKTFVPLTRERLTKRGILQTFLRPLFPNYIFIQLILNQHWSPINSTRGIKYLLTGAAGQTIDDDFAPPIPIPVKQTVIAKLLQFPIIDINLGPQPGDKVTLLATVFKDEIALVQAISNNRIFVILDTTKTQISIHKDQVAPYYERQERQIHRS